MKQYAYKINGRDYLVAIESIEGNRARLNVNGIALDVEMQQTALTEDNLPQPTAAEGAPAPAPAAAAPAPEAAPAPAKGSAGAGTPVKAPLPGVVTQVAVAQGQAVRKGQTVVVLEAMKMENNITAEQDGTVSGICVAPGDSVLEGATLVTIE